MALGVALTFAVTPLWPLTQSRWLAMGFGDGPSVWVAWAMGPPAIAFMAPVGAGLLLLAHRKNRSVPALSVVGIGMMICGGAGLVLYGSGAEFRHVGRTLILWGLVISAAQVMVVPLMMSRVSTRVPRHTSTAMIAAVLAWSAMPGMALDRLPYSDWGDSVRVGALTFCGVYCVVVGLIVAVAGPWLQRSAAPASPPPVSAIPIAIRGQTNP